MPDAIAAVRSGDAWGAVYFNDNYTDSLVARLALGEISFIYFLFLEKKVSK